MKTPIFLLLVLSSSSFAQVDDRASAIPQYRWACGDMSEAECREYYARQQSVRAPEPRSESPEDRVAQEIVERTNSERRSRGLPSLRVDPHCTRAIADHAEDMAARDYLSHTGRGGSDPTARYRRHSRNQNGAGENIAYNWDGSARSFTDQWMNSQGHRENILRGSYTHIGVAVRRGKCHDWGSGQKKCKYYAGQCFLRSSN